MQQQLRVGNVGRRLTPTCAPISISSFSRSTASPAPTPRSIRSSTIFTSAVQALTTSPSSTAAQSQALSAAQALAQQLNSATNTIQTLRSQADQGIAGDVQQANNALQQIASINQQLAGQQFGRQRVGLARKPARPIHRSTVQAHGHPRRPGQQQPGRGLHRLGRPAGRQRRPRNSVSTPPATITAAQQWNADPTKSGLGTITLVSPARRQRRSRRQRRHTLRRDRRLSQHARQRPGAGAEPARRDRRANVAGAVRHDHCRNCRWRGGFDADIGGLSNGNTIQVSYTDASNVQHNVTIVRVDDPSALPLSNSATTDPNDTVIGVDFSGGVASVATAAQYRARRDRAAVFQSVRHDSWKSSTADRPPITVNAVSTTATATSLDRRLRRACRFFVDGATAYHRRDSPRLDRRAPAMPDGSRSTAR